MSYAWVVLSNMEEQGTASDKRFDVGINLVRVEFFWQTCANLIK